MKIKDITQYLETLAPLSLQENYDNSGLIVGNSQTKITNCLITLDCTEAVVDEAISKKAQLIIAHHPIVFGGLKKFNGKNYIERVVIKAIQNNIAIYAIHTNLDNVLAGVNHEIGKRLGLKNLNILQPKKQMLQKLVAFVPEANFTALRDALFAAGAGQLGHYSECSFSQKGVGTFKANAGAKPYVGEVNKLHQEKEVRLEVLVSNYNMNSVKQALFKNHPYQEVAFDVYPLENENQEVGAGMVGELEIPLGEVDFLKKVKNQLNTACIRHTKLLQKEVRKVAFCGGSGSFLLEQAKQAGAQVFITGDFKYHQFFDAEEELVIFDVGHFESEQFTIDLLCDYITEKFSNIAVLKTEVNTNPISYF